MTLWQKIKELLACATICASSGCSAYQIFVHPHDDSSDLVSPEQLSKHEMNVEERMTALPQGKKIPPGGETDGKLKFDIYHFYNRFYARLNQRMNERLFIDLQESRIRDFYYTRDETQYLTSIRKGHEKNDTHGDMFESQFTNDFYNESQKIAAKGIRDALKDLELYELVRPFFEFNIKKDSVPFTDKKITSAEDKETNQKNQPPIDPIDEFDERILNPQKVKGEELNEDWLMKRLTDAAVGVNVNYDLFKAGKDFGLEPYAKWMNIFRWTYDTRNSTIEHKLSFPVYNIGIGFSAETDVLFTRVDKLNASIGYSINKNTKVSLDMFKQFYDADSKKDNKDEGISLGFFWKF